MLAKWPSLLGKLQAREGACLKTQGGWVLTKKKKKMTSIIDLWPLSVYLCTLLPLRMHVYLHRHKITNKVNAVKNKTPG